MNKHIASIAVITLAAIGVAKAQYPRIPPEVQEKSDSLMRVARKPSDAAWVKAQEVMKASGKPFIPWAKNPEDLPQSKLAAFPGAEGGGMYTEGGRGGRVFVVTSLADSGPGTLREACEAGGPRIVVFNVSGIIRLNYPINIKAPYITIEGQSAPGDGICIAGESTLIDTHDVIIRYVRFRRGATDVTRRDDALGGNPVGNIIIDHVSASWGLDENMSIYRHVYDRAGQKQEKMATVNVTIQNSIFSEALDTYNHAFGSTIGGHNSTFMRNLWANNIARNPSVGMDGDFGFFNNVVFNWWNRSSDGGDNHSLYNFINNYFKPGPITPMNEPIAHRILKPEAGRNPGDKTHYGKVYVSGNIIDGNERVTKNNWDGGVQIGEMPDAGRYTDSIKADKPLPIKNKVTIIPAKDAYTYVLANVGASLPKRDPVDTRIVGDVTTGKIAYNTNASEIKLGIGAKYVKERLPDTYKQGIISDISQVGGYPEYKGTPYKDSDNDGMPDEYEVKHGLNPKDASDSPKLAKDGSGYANIEVYLNSLVPLSKVVPSTK